MNRRLAYLALAALLACPTLPVLAYSGAGAECPDDAIPALAALGSPEQFDQELTRVATLRLHWRQKAAERSCFLLYCSGNKADLKPITPERVAVEKLFISGHALPCTSPPVTPLEIAVAAGNLNNTRMLLEMGTDPSAPEGVANEFRSTLPMRCVRAEDISTSGRPKPLHIEKPPLEALLASYKELFAHGLNINQRNTSGKTALHLCNDPALLKFFLSQGAQTDINDSLFAENRLTPLEHRIRELPDSAEQLESIGTYKRKDKGDGWIGSLELLSKLQPNKLENEYALRGLCRHCQSKDIEPRVSAICAMLARNIVGDSRIFERRATTETGDSCDFLNETPASIKADLARKKKAAEPRPPISLHVIGVYEGALPPGTDDRPWWAICKDGSTDKTIKLDERASRECFKKYASIEREIAVTVTDIGHPMVLALMSQEAGHWNLKLKDGVKVVKVILSGYRAQRISGMPPNTPLEIYTYEPSACDQCKLISAYLHGDVEGHKAMSPQLQQVIGLPVTTFQGRYSGAEFSITPDTH